MQGRYKGRCRGDIRGDVGEIQGDEGREGAQPVHPAQRVLGPDRPEGLRRLLLEEPALREMWGGMGISRVGIG